MIVPIVEQNEENLKLLLYPFVKIKVYDNKQRDILLFECLSEPMQSEYWSIEKVQIDPQIYNQILVLTDEMLSMED